MCDQASPAQALHDRQGWAWTARSWAARRAKRERMGQEVARRAKRERVPLDLLTGIAPPADRDYG